ncbi:hypothetical protein TNCV_4036811 [Trichonephila clavipes]|nr:hypothetical protein TNCV_4036811 [Trichonephila clavipes]
MAYRPPALSLWVIVICEMEASVTLYRFWRQCVALSGLSLLAKILNKGPETTLLPLLGRWTTVPVSVNCFHRVDTTFLEILRFLQQVACDWFTSGQILVLAARVQRTNVPPFLRIFSYFD